MRSFLVIAALATASGKIIKSENGELIENEYIVVLRPNATKADRDSHIALLGQDAQVLYTYDHVYTGYAVRVSSESVMARLSEHPDVEYVEQNGIARALQTCLNGPANPAAGLWGLSRVSFPTIQSPLRPVRYSSSRGADIYILDTGLNYNHVDFSGRAAFAFDATNEGPNDQNGHGTHCGGTAGGALYGIAKSARILDVKVLGRSGSGSWAGIIAGVDYVGNQAGNRVASMSLGGGTNTAVNDAVNRLAARAGAIVSVASGNSNANACNFSPAGASGAVTVNSIANNDARSGFSNWGTCTDIFAPGTNVLSAWIGSTSATNTISGTSMACPHVSGVISDMWGRRPLATNAEIRNRLFAISTLNRVTNPGTGSPNRLAQVDCTTV